MNQTILIDPADVTLSNLSDFVHQKVGEASTLFHTSDGVFDEQSALRIADDHIKAVHQIVRECGGDMSRIEGTHEKNKSALEGKKEK